MEPFPDDIKQPLPDEQRLLEFDHRDRDDTDLFDPIFPSKDDPSPDELFRNSPTILDLKRRITKIPLQD